jgi:predicted porin
VEPYYKEYKNLAIEDAVSQFLNEGRGQANGVDITIKKRSDDLYLYATYTYVDSERQTSTKSTKQHTFYLETPHTLQVAASYNHSENIVPSVLVQYHTGTPYTPITGTNDFPYNDQTLKVPIYGTPFSKRLPSYFTLNLKLAYIENISTSEQIEFSFELMNATNHENVQDIRYDDDYKIEGYNYQFPITPWFDVTYRF